MEITAVVPKLLLQIISSAFQRCRLAEDLCRLSVLLDQSTERDPPITCISIAHTGIGCNVEEFQDLRCPREFNGAKIWGLNDFRIVEMGYSPSRQLVSFVPLIDSFGYRPESLLMPLIALISPGFAYKFNGGTYTFLSSIRSSPQSYRILLSHLKNHCGTCYCSSLILLHCADGSAGFSDDEVYYYHINLDEYISNKRLKRQPSQAKNGAKFSGTEVSLCVFGSMDVLVAPIIGFFQKMLVLQIPNVTMDLMVKQGVSPGTQTQYIFTVNADKTPCFTASNLERLKSGLEDYVLRHGNYLDTMCDYCFSDREHLKVGSGTVCHEEKHKRAGGTMEVVIVICDLLETTQHCSISCDSKTQVLYFDNYSPSPIPRFALSALKKIDWKSYGLILANVNDQDGHVFLEWENFPSYVQIQIALHWYHNQYPTRQKNGPGINLVKKGIKNALDDLKAKNEGFLLSSHARKICSYVPDLARSIAGLIFSSTDLDFQGDCLSVLGFQPQEVEREAVEDCIQRKIVTVIGMNERKPQKDQEAAPFLFFDGDSETSYFEYEEVEGEYYSTSLE